MAEPRKIFQDWKHKYKYYLLKQIYMALNGMHTSEVLNKEIFNNQPRETELQKKIASMMHQFSPDNASTKVQEVLNRIWSLWDTLTSLAGQTRAEIVSLYVETVTKTHLSDYSNKVAILEAHHSNRVANILGASANDSIISKKA